MTDTEKAAVVQLTDTATVGERQEIRSLLEANGYETKINIAGGEIFAFRQPD